MSPNTLLEDEKPDYRFYTLAQLYDVKANIDQNAYPERYQELLDELTARENGAAMLQAEAPSRQDTKHLQGLASRWTRLGASLIDAALSIVVTIPMIIYFDVIALAKEGELSLAISVKFFFIGLLLFLAMHGHFLSKYGQTIGKRLLNIKIVNLDGKTKPKFIDLFTKRYLSICVASLIPVIGQFIPLLDSLFIFRQDKRCLHDFMANTTVVVNDNKSSIR